MVSQGSLLGPLPFLIYIKNLSNNLSSNPKLFADGTSLFSDVHNLSGSTNNLIEDLKKINVWANQSKRIFKQDPTKQAQEVMFSRKIKKNTPHSTYFQQHKDQVNCLSKHLGLILDSQLSF